MDSARKILQFVRPGTVIDFPQGSETEIGLDKLVNRLNFINFQEDSILVNFRHPKQPRTVTLEATPLPCVNNTLECRWHKESELPPGLHSLLFENIFVMDGQKLVVAVPRLVSLGREGASFLLPEKAVEVNFRKTRRHPCQGVRVELWQNGARLAGELLDFSAVSFRIEAHTSGTPFEWVNQDEPVQVALSREEQILYSGQCRILTRDLGEPNRIYVLEPAQDRMRRFRAKEIRSSREQLLPLPDVVFRHPLTGRTVDLKVLDISGCGFAVHEEIEHSVLCAGMFIPDLQLEIAGGFTARASAQVVYRQIDPQPAGSSVKCGLAFLDMDVREHANLLSLLALARDKHRSPGGRADAEQLWQFLFETGLISPERYPSLQAKKNELREAFERLYSNNPALGRHFIYQEKGVVLGHIAMLRFYRESWLIHHHAAAKSAQLNAGLTVLSRLAHAVNDSHNLRSAHMNYVICYYRQTDKFLNRILGNAARTISDRSGCAIDSFALLRYHRAFAEEWNFEAGWELTPCSGEDLLELASSQQQATWLMLQALDLASEAADRQGLARQYREAGFAFQRSGYALKWDGNLKAVFCVSNSDAGLGLSDFTSCIHLLVLDQDELPKEIVYLTLSILTHRHELSEVPVLVHPVSYAQSADLAYETSCSLWTLNIAQAGPLFLKYLSQLMERSRKPRHGKSAEVSRDLA